jgi:hypothetical protein
MTQRRFMLPAGFCPNRQWLVMLHSTVASENQKRRGGMDDCGFTGPARQLSGHRPMQWPTTIHPLKAARFCWRFSGRTCI